jgi:hypothetical protein
MKELATEYIKEQSEADIDFKRQVELLDNYDFSEYLTHGRSIWSVREAIENKYDEMFKNVYGVYTFEILDGYDTCMYFESRYNVWFQEYQDWVVRHDNGAYEKARRRIEDSSQEMV